MKKVLIATDYKCIGGVEKSLINMLKYVNLENYNVKIRALSTHNENTEFINQIPQSVEYEHERIMEFRKVILQHIKKCKFINIIKILLCNFLGNEYTKDMMRLENVKYDDEVYDIAIAYHSVIHARLYS